VSLLIQRKAAGKAERGEQGKRKRKRGTQGEGDKAKQTEAV